MAGKCYSYPNRELGEGAQRAGLEDIKRHTDLKGRTHTHSHTHSFTHRSEVGYNAWEEEEQKDRDPWASSRGHRERKADSCSTWWMSPFGELGVAGRLC